MKLPLRYGSAAAIFLFIVKKPHAERVERQPALAFEKKNLQK